MGRGKFGPQTGPWEDESWRGWWGEEPPFHHPVFVLTQYAREPLVMAGGTTFYFVTDGLEAALTQARQAAGGKDITLGGGANVARQYLAAGLVDEMLIHLAPILLGDGERLFVGLGDNLHGLKLVQTLATPSVVHLKFAK
ncbi:MAG: dihydrofolate reductase family protein, partial [Caldilineaceae bacterium]|nr:dihydrofolate reductase family protein [Caldilineaceae bacterium]